MPSDPRLLQTLNKEEEGTPLCCTIGRVDPPKEARGALTARTLQIRGASTTEKRSAYSWNCRAGQSTQEGKARTTTGTRLARSRRDNLDLCLGMGCGGEGIASNYPLPLTGIGTDRYVLSCAATGGADRAASL